MPFKTPFNLGPFTVDNKGQISPRTNEPAPGFTFRWSGRTIHARLMPGGEDTMNLSLKARLGRIPSTAGSGSESRMQTFDVLRAMPATLPAGWRIRILPDHQFRLEVERHIDTPTTATALVTQLTCFLIALSPYLETLDEAGVSQNCI